MSQTLSTALPEASDPATPSVVASAARLAWWREPLIHFLLLGGLLFAADHVLVNRSDDPRTIVVGANVDAEARQTFKAARGREPNAQELEALRRVWLDNEVLYREGLALQVDKGDTAIRERVIFKALSVVDANTKLPAVDDKALRQWFDGHRAKYDDPPRYDFQEAVLAGEQSEARVRALVSNLGNGAGGETEAGLRVFKARPQPNLDQSYGPDFAKALQALPAQTWQAVRGKDGWRAIRVENITPARPGQFEALRNVVLQDWTDATLAAQRSAAVQTLSRKYTIKVAGSAR
jgi:hypothetical protein